nr:low molecular weight protein-tyrosine-phosphatase [Gallaecimonas xiamenensis]
MVCMGNICRSPTAQAVAEKHFADAGIEVEVDSAGTIGYHAGESPDRRARQAGEARGYDFSQILARQVTSDDFVHFDLLLAMDRRNYGDLISRCPERHRHKVKLLLSYAPELGVDEVPDPYYGGGQGFEEVLDLVEAATAGLLKSLRP